MLRTFQVTTLNLYCVEHTFVHSSSLLLCSYMLDTQGKEEIT